MRLDRSSTESVLTCPCGCGTYIVCALGHQACLKDYSTRYYRLSRLILVLTQAKAGGSYNKRLNTLANFDLLIIDDWGLEPLTAATLKDLMEIMDNRHDQSAIAIFSQLPTDQWYQAIGDNTLADALIRPINAQRASTQFERRIHAKKIELIHST